MNEINDTTPPENIETTAPKVSDTASCYASRRCPNCFWGLYDGEYCLNSACDYKGAEALLLTQKQALLMIYARGADHPLSNGYCSEEWMKRMKVDILA